MKAQAREINLASRRAGIENAAERNEKTDFKILCVWSAVSSDIWQLAQGMSAQKDNPQFKTVARSRDIE